MVKEYEVITVKLADLKDDPSNPNTFSKEQHAGLKKSYQKFGNLKFIVVDNDNMVIDGHQRISELKALGETETRALRVHPKDQSERILIRQTLNKLYGEHDKKLDSNDYLVLFQNQQLGELAELLAKPQEEFQRALEKHHGIEFVKEDDCDVDKALQELPITKTGDVWQLGRHRLMCGSCTETDHVHTLLDGKFINAVLTDPPYGMNKDMSNDADNESALGNLYFQAFEDAHDLAYHDASFVCFQSTRSFPIALKAAMMTGWAFERMLWIYKPNDITFPWRGWLLKSEAILLFTKGKGSWHDRHPFHHDTYTFNHKGGELPKDIEKQVGSHPSIKPQDVLMDIIPRISEIDEIIYDPFCGSGSTLIACEQTNRICYAMEIDPHYCTVIIRRWEQLTGQKAVQISSLQTKSTEMSVENDPK